MPRLATKCRASHLPGLTSEAGLVTVGDLVARGFLEAVQLHHMVTGHRAMVPRASPVLDTVRRQKTLHAEGPRKPTADNKSGEY